MLKATAVIIYNILLLDLCVSQLVFGWNDGFDFWKTIMFTVACLMLSSAMVFS